MQIRPAVHTDVDAVFSLVEQLSELYDVEEDSFRAAFGEAIDEANASTLLVAVNDAGQVIGYALMVVAKLLYTSGEAAQLQEIIVDSGSQGVGVGSSLVHAVEDICRERSIDHLMVASSRAPAFYDRLDYRSTADFLKKSFSDGL